MTTADDGPDDEAPVDVRNVTAAEWEDILPLCHARRLRMYHLTTTSLDGIEALTEVRDLELDWATKVETLAPVFRMTGLTRLSISHFSKLRSLDGIEALSSLTELELTGNRASLVPPLVLETIEPLARLPKLESLSITNTRLEDDDITPLARCASLRRLHLSMYFDRAQLAFLAGRLNDRLEEPVTGHMDGGPPCRQCGAEKVTFAGRRTVSLCRVCDRRRFDKLMDEFDAMARAAAA